MDFSALAQSVWDQLALVSKAPVPFIAALLLAGVVLWKMAQREYSVRLANATSTNEMLRERLERLQTSDAMAIAATSQQLEANSRTEQSALSIRNESREDQSSDPKVFVRDDINPERLLGVFEGRTELQARSLIQPEIGKWMVVTGPVLGVTPLSSGSVLVALRVADAHSGLLMTFCSFAVVTPELEKLSQGDSVTIEGQLEEVSSLGVQLDHCKLIGLD